MYASTTTTTSSGSTTTTTTSSTSGASSHYLLDCFPAPPNHHQHVSFPMSHLRHSGPHLLPGTPRSPLLALPAEIDAGSSSFATDFSSNTGALGLQIASQQQPSTSASTAAAPAVYSPPTVISFGEEWTDDNTSDDLESSDEPHSSAAARPRSLDVFGDSDSYFAFSPASPSSSSSLSPELATEQLPLWQAEHPRLLSIRDAVLSSERAARYREACLESEVARIKDDLTRVQEARARARWVASRADPAFRRNSAPDSSSHARAPIPLVRRASDSDVATHHQRRAAAEQQHHAESTAWFSFDDGDEIAITVDEAPVPAESTGQFWDEDYPDSEAVLANHLTEMRSARAEERRKRKRDHERIRELGILLSLGSEVRQWEERLAWENAFRANDAMELDHIDDASSRRRSKSLPTTPPSGSSSSSSSTGSGASFASSLSSSPSSPLTPPLPPLSASPLWRVSAEMILRRRSLSERPPRVSPVITLAPTHESSEVPDGASTSTGSDGSGSCAKRQAVPPPIAIPRSPSSVSLKSAPSRPSALKLCFTLEDLVAPEHEREQAAAAAAAAVVVEKIEEDAREDEEMCNSSEECSEASDSDDSRCKSSSSASSSSENENENESEKRLALRRGRSRWSWRKSLQSVQQLQQIAADMEVDDA